MTGLPWIVAIVLVLAACGDDASGPAATPPSTTSPTSPQTTAAGTTPDGPTSDVGEGTTAPRGEDDESVITRATRDLAERLGVAERQVELVSFERVTWNSGALGCPQPGELYTQALVEGSLTILEFEGTEYRYHAGSDDRPFLCEQPALESRPGGPEPTTGPPES